MRYRVVPVEATGETFEGAEVLLPPLGAADPLASTLFLRVPHLTDEIAENLRGALHTLSLADHCVIFGGDVEIVELQPLDDERPVLEVGNERGAK